MRSSIVSLLVLALAACTDDVDDTDVTDTDSDADTDTDTDADTDTDTDTDTDADADLAIAGSWVDEWGTAHTITNDTWSDAYDNVFHISQYDNDASWLVAENDAANFYNPELWSRFDWAFVGSDLYYCQTDYDAIDEAAALATTPADPTDPTTSGCGGFAWTAMTAQ